jgi:hypothetical protein
VAVDDPLDGRKTDSIPGEFLDRMQSLEGVKEFIGMAKLKPAPLSRMNRTLSPSGVEAVPN